MYKRQAPWTLGANLLKLLKPPTSVSLHQDLVQQDDEHDEKTEDPGTAGPLRQSAPLENPAMSETERSVLSNTVTSVSASFLPSATSSIGNEIRKSPTYSVTTCPSTFDARER